jgi:hypothetical protein
MSTQFPYLPPIASSVTLGGIVNLLRDSATPLTAHNLIGARYVCKFPGKELYFDSKLDLDSDGSAYAAQDRTGQAQTSLRYANGTSVDADRVPFFVLPRHFYQQHGIRLGDVAAVIYYGRLAYAMFADVGPRHRIGEGSIALHRALGHETVHHGRLHNVGISRDVITIVFPGSGNGTPQMPDAIASIGRNRYSLLSSSFELKAQWS